MSLSTGATNAQNFQNIIGGMIGSAMQKNQHAERRSLSEEERQCLLRVTQGIPRLHQALERGTLSPFDPRVAQFRASCMKGNVTPEQVSTGNNPKFQILVLANLSETDATRTLDGKINFSGKSSDGKSEIAASVERFTSSIAARSFDIQIMSQIPGRAVTGNQINREYLFSVLERAFRKKHPEITAKISMTWSSGASLIFVPKYDFSGAQSRAQSSGDKYSSGELTAAVDKRDRFSIMSGCGPRRFRQHYFLISAATITFLSASSSCKACKAATPHAMSCSPLPPLRPTPPTTSPSTTIGKPPTKMANLPSKLH